MRRPAGGENVGHALLRIAIARRGLRKYSVWYQPKLKADGGNGIDSSIAEGTPNADFQMWMEGDERTRSYTIPQAKVVGKGEEGAVGTVPDAYRFMRTGTHQWCEIKTEEEAERLRKEHSDQLLAQQSAANEAGAEWVFITTRDIEKQKVLIENWRDGLAYVMAAKNYDLETYRRRTLNLLTEGKQTTIRELLRSFEESEAPLAVAAFFRLAQSGLLTTDLHAAPFSLRTKFARLAQ